MRSISRNMALFNTVSREVTLKFHVEAFNGHDDIKVRCPLRLSIPSAEPPTRGSPLRGGRRAITNNGDVPLEASFVFVSVSVSKLSVSRHELKTALPIFASLRWLPSLIRDSSPPCHPH